eukprot:3812009-Rhodomonas_salina.3
MEAVLLLDMADALLFMVPVLTWMVRVQWTRMRMRESTQVPYPPRRVLWNVRYWRGAICLWKWYDVSGTDIMLLAYARCMQCPVLTSWYTPMRVL